MRKAKTLGEDELRSEYKSSDFGALVRGKYLGRLQTSSNVVVIDPARILTDEEGRQFGAAVPPPGEANEHENDVA